MHELPRIIRDPQVLLALAPEELAAKLLPVLKARAQREKGLLPPLSSAQTEPFSAPRNDGLPAYPPQLSEEVKLAIAEAWSWLEAQGLLVPAPGVNRARGFRVLSRRAKSFADERAVADFVVARRLPKEALRPRIANTAWQAFMRGEYDVAVFQAIKAVEVAVREAAGLDSGLFGAKLMRAAFAPETGPLADPNVERGEQVGRMELFAGAIASYRNPMSQQEVDLDDPEEALEIILLANHLLRIVELRAASKTGSQPQLSGTSPPQLEAGQSPGAVSDKI
jgi:uncharacterized protein (TIGR02391 family)